MIQLQHCHACHILDNTEKIKWVYKGDTLIWQWTPMSHNGFIKYDDRNMWFEFLGSLVDPNAPWDQTLVHDLPDDFISTEEITAYIAAYDEMLQYSGNLSTAFLPTNIVGISDEPFTYTFLDYTTIVDNDALWDTSYDSVLNVDYTGEDTGDVEYVYTYKELLQYDTNFNVEFVPATILGVLDQIVTPSFFSNSPTVAGIYDQSMEINIAAEFIDNSTTDTTYINLYDELLAYTTNFNVEFKAINIIGLVDQDLWYTFGTDFLGYTNNGDPSALWDSTAAVSTSTDFTGTDTGDNPHEDEWLQQLSYISNMNVEFIDYTTTGRYDQMIVYSYNTIATKFID